MKNEAVLSDDAQLAQFISRFMHDPLGYVKAVYRWGEGDLLEQDGPDGWQIKFLRELGEETKRNNFDGKTAVPPVRRAVSSGHGVGKSTMTAWVVSWILDTRPNSQGSVTANTGMQLSTKTWAAIKSWKQRAITAHWWDIGAEKIRNVAYPDSWFCAALTSNEDRSEAFAGQHAASSSSFYCFDESSAIPDRIFEVAEGGLTDGEPFSLMLGNPTKNSGQFYRACFGSDKSRWNPVCIDSRESPRTNKATIEEWGKTYGEDSDFFRVRVLGLPPRAADTQFIAQDLVQEAMKRKAHVISNEPLLAGVDISRGGNDSTVIRFRRGADAVSIKPIEISGELSRDSMRTVSILSEIMQRDFGGGLKIAAMFIDATAVGGPIADRMRQLFPGRAIIQVQFGSSSPLQACAQMRAYIWYQMREWLKIGSIGNDLNLEMELTGPGFKHNAQSAIVLESKEDMKKRGIMSPNHADALATTFAQAVGARRQTSGKREARDEKVRQLSQGCTEMWMA